jgi:hypothetical protein
VLARSAKTESVRAPGNPIGNPWKSFAKLLLNLRCSRLLSGSLYVLGSTFHRGFEPHSLRQLYKTPMFMPISLTSDPMGRQPRRLLPAFLVGPVARRLQRRSPGVGCTSWFDTTTADPLPHFEFRLQALELFDFDFEQIRYAFPFGTLAHPRSPIRRPELGGISELCLAESIDSLGTTALKRLAAAVQLRPWPPSFAHSLQLQCGQDRPGPLNRAMYLI